MLPLWDETAKPSLNSWLLFHYSTYLPLTLLSLTIIAADIVFYLGEIINIVFEKEYPEV